MTLTIPRPVLDIYRLMVCDEKDTTIFGVFIVFVTN